MTFIIEATTRERTRDEICLYLEFIANRYEYDSRNALARERKLLEAKSVALRACIYMITNAQFQPERVA